MPRAVTPEFVVNTWTGTWQDNPDVTALENGNVVVIWDSRYSEADVDLQYVAAQVFRPDGTPVGEEKILSDLDLIGDHARVEALEGGGFAVAWEAGPESVLTRTDIYTATYDNTGERVSPFRKVNPPTDDYHFASEVVSHADGGYSVLWSRWLTGNDEEAFHGDNAFARSYSYDGTAESGAFQVNGRTFATQSNLRATRLSNDNVVTVWESEYGSQSPYSLPSDLRARILGPDGLPVTPEFGLAPEVNGPNSGDVTGTDISVAALTEGRFVATWVQTVLEGRPDGDTAYRLYGRIFSADGTPETAAFKINTFDSNIPDNSSVVGLAGGGFAVVWDQFADEVDGTRFEEVFGQYYSEYGVRIGNNFLVNQDTSQSEEWPSIAALDNGGIFVTYESEYLDGDYDAVAGRIFSGLTTQQAQRAGAGQATNGDDIFHGTERVDTLYGGSGRDVLQGGGHNDTLYGNGHGDVLRGGDGRDKLYGGWGWDRLYGGNGRDVLRGGDHNDMLYGNGRGDDLWGDAGDDKLHGGWGWDSLYGGSGHDSLTGGQGSDELYGGDQGDWLRGKAGADKLNGGAGWDRLIGGGGDDKLFGSRGEDFLHGGSGHDSLTGGQGSDELYGGNQGDWLHGKAGADKLHGGAGWDRLIGGGGDDKLFGSRGEDFLHGGSGHDSLTGGQGSDTFIFRQNDGNDVIADFDTGLDRLLLASAFGDRLEEARVDAGDAVFTFGDGQRLVLQDVNDLDAVINVIEFV